nr:hypothetical protein [uncultured Roseococcus sp.]
MTSPLNTPVGALPRQAPPEEHRRHNEAVAETAIEQDRAAFEATRNPIYFWCAVDTHSTVNGDRARAGEPPLPFPAWIGGHLGIVARRLRDVTAGLDWREAPMPFGEIPVPEKPRSEWGEADIAAAGDALSRARRRKPNRVAARAVKDAVQALGLQTQGRNAFDEVWRRENDAMDAQAIDLFTGRFPDAHGRLGALSQAEDGKWIVTPTVPVTEAEAIEMLTEENRSKGPNAGRRTRRKVLPDEDRDDVANEATATRNSVRRGRRRRI